MNLSAAAENAAQFNPNQQQQMFQFNVPQPQAPVYAWQLPQPQEPVYAWHMPQPQESQFVPQQNIPKPRQQIQQTPVFNPQVQNSQIQPVYQQPSLDIAQMNKQQTDQAIASVIKRLNAISAEMKRFIYERDDVIDDIIRALVAQHHVLLLGPPGTAKTFLAKEITSRITGARLFSWLLNKSSDPSEILGPISLKSMEQDKFKRILDGKIADCEVCYLDEIYKANEPALNALLSILNERVVFNDGQAHPVPLKILIASSNEVPEEGDGLEAIHDRLMLKHWVMNIQDKGNRGKMMQEHARRTAYGAQNNFAKTVISLDELIFINNAMRMVTVDAGTYKSLTSALNQLDKEGIRFSDRKLNWCIDIIRAQAILSGRMATVSDDILSLVYALWEDWSDVEKIREILLKCVNPLKSVIESELASIKQLYEEILDIADDNFKDNSGVYATTADAKMRYAIERKGKAESINAKLQQKISEASKHGIDVSQYSAKIKDFNDKINSTIRQIANIDGTVQASRSGQAF